MRTFLSLILVTLLSVTTIADSFFMPTDLGTSARMIGLGNMEGFSDKANTIFENPAGLYRLSGGGFSAFTSTLMDEVVYTNLAIATPTPFGTFGLGYMEVGVTEIPHTGQRNDLNSTFFPEYFFDYKNSLFRLSWQTMLMDNLSFGASLTRYDVVFDDVVGNGMNVDIGGIWDLYPLELSLSVHNVLQDQKLDYNDGAEETLPRQWVGSVRYQLDDIALMAQLRHLRQENAASYGVVFSPSFLPMLDVYGARKEFFVIDDRKSAVTLGIGLRLFSVQFNYAYEKSEHIEFDNHNYFSIDVMF